MFWLVSAGAYSTADFLNGPIAMSHRVDREVLFSGAEEPMDSKQAVVNTLLSRGVPVITLGTGTTRESGLSIQLTQDRLARTPVLVFLAERMQLDADTPADLKKVTLTRCHASIVSGCQTRFSRLSMSDADNGLL